MSGWLKGEYIAAGIDQAAAGIRAEAAADAHLSDVRKLARQRDEMESHNAANLSEKHALRAALRKADPNHPLLTNTSLQERVKAAGSRALAMTNDWNAVREAGETFKY